MFCPNCKAEYRDGFTMCADCNVPLVTSLDDNVEKTDPIQEHQNDDITFVPVLSTYNLGDISLIRSLLDNEGIEYFLQGENTAYIRGYMDPTILMVREDQVSIVKELLKEFKINFTMFSTK